MSESNEFKDWVWRFSPPAHKGTCRWWNHPVHRARILYVWLRNEA